MLLSAQVVQASWAFWGMQTHHWLRDPRTSIRSWEDFRVECKGAQNLTGVSSKPWLDILGKHPGGRRIGKSFWVGLPRKVPTCVILSEWVGRSKAELLPTPEEYKTLCRLPGLCPSRLEAGVTKATGGMYWNIPGPSAAQQHKSSRLGAIGGFQN